MKIEMIQQDIDTGIPMNCKFCPISQALKRMTGRSFTVSNQNVHDDIQFRTHDLPLKAIEFIHNFDFGETPDPISFDIETLQG